MVPTCFFEFYVFFKYSVRFYQKIACENLNKKNLKVENFAFNVFNKNNKNLNNKSNSF